MASPDIPIQEGEKSLATNDTILRTTTTLHRLNTNRTHPFDSRTDHSLSIDNVSDFDLIDLYVYAPSSLVHSTSTSQFMSLDPASPTTPEHERHHNNLQSLQSPPNSAQYDSALEYATRGATQDFIKPTESAKPTRDKGKDREMDNVTNDNDSSTIVRFTDAEAVKDSVSNPDGTSDASASGLAAMDISELAPELLMRIFAFLDPVSLSRAAAVCRSWAIIARDDATWRAAFATYFSLEAAQAHRAASLEASATPALRRLTNASWRQEFQQRVDLLRQWRKSRTPTVLSTPRVDLIKKISLSKQHRLLISATDTYGVASRSNPWTGKVIKGYLDAEGTANGAGNGNPNVEFSPNVSSLNTSSDASHIFWGFRSGEVGITTMSRQGTHPRGAIKSLRFTPRAAHVGPVTAIAIPFASDSDGAHGPGRSPERLRLAIAALGDVASTFVTAGFDGTVRLWTFNRSWPLWIASSSTKAPAVTSNAISSGTQAQTNAAVAAPICALAYDAKKGIVAAGSTTGKIFVWANIDVAALLRIPPEATDPEHLRNGSPEAETLEAQAVFLRLSQSIRATTIDMPPGNASEVAVNSIHIDASSSATGKGSEMSSNTVDCSLLVHHSGARVLLRHRIFQDAPVETTVLGAAVMDEITAIRPDFEPRLPKRDARSSAAQSPSTSVYASPTLSATRPEVGGLGGNALHHQQPPTLVLGPSPFESYDGSGQYPERKYVCVGTRAGSLFLFDWESSGSTLDEATQEEWQGHSPPRFRGEKQLLPSIGWEAHHTTITALEVTPLHIFVGTSDGTIKVFDSLAGDLIRTINDRTATRHPARMLAAGELTATEAARFRVTQIIADNECLVASIGHQVLAFRAEPVLSKRAAAAAAAAAAASSGKAKGGRPRLADNKYAMQVELRRDLRESKAELEAENEERQAEYSKIRNRQGFELEGLSEQEALEYALMLSRDEEAASATTKAKFMGGSGYVPGSYASSSRKKIEVPEQAIVDPELADALEQIALAESKAEAEEAYRQACEPPVSFYERPSARASRRSSSSASSSVAKTGRSSRYRMLEDQDFGDDLLDDDDQEEESGGDHELDPYLRPSPSPSPSASPYMSGLSSPPASRAWTILSQAGSSATTPAHSSDRWGKNSKVRTVNVPRSARFPLASPTPAEAASISSSLSSMGALSPPELSSPRDFPSMTMAAVAGSMSASPNHVGGGGVSPMFRRPSSGFGPGLDFIKPTESAKPTRDKGKDREMDNVTNDNDSSTIVRFTDAEAVKDSVSNPDGTSDASASGLAAMDISELAPELLMRIFAFLDPVSLSRAAAVCRSWAIIARDDATWRAAFATYFSLEAAQAHRAASLEASATPALRRLTNASWRQEFQQRVDLLRQWRKSRTPTVLSTPRVDLIKKISLSKQHRLLISATDTYGVASRSNPWTGKVIKGYLDAEGTANGAGNGNPNVEFSPNVSSLNTSSDASHIFWGFRSGEVGITTMSRQGTHPRGAIKSLRFTPRAAHVGPVTAIAIPFASDSDGAHGPGRSPERLRLAIAALGDVASTFVTAGFDGTVRLWTFNRSWPLWIASSSTKAPAVTSNAISSGTQAQTNAAVAAPICALAYDAKKGIVAAGSTTGKIFVWANIDVAALLRIPPEATDPEHLRNGSPEAETLEAQAVFLRLSQSIRATTIDMPPGNASEVAVNSIHIDASSSATGKGSEMSSNTVDCSLLVHHSGARVLLRHRIFQDAPVETTVLGAAVMDEITAIRPDFEPRLPKRDARSSAAQSPSTSVYASPTLSATRPEVGGLGGNALHHQQPPTLVLGPSPFESYDGSGQYPERKYVCVGTRAGSLFLFDWESSGSTLDEATQEEWQGHSPPRFRGEKQLLPSIGWEAHHTTITALEVTPLHIFVGTSDGTIKVFDSLAGDLIRTINDRTATRHPARMLAAGELTATEAARFRVTQIIADNECLVASIGHQVLAFRAEPVLSKRAAAAAAAAAAASSGKAKGGRPRLADNKYAMQVELRRDLRESKAELEAENEERQAEYSKIRNRQGFELEGLSEQEALEYALMLSRDEEAASATTKAKFMGGSGYVPGSYASSSRKKIEVPEQAIVDPELADALEQIALAESKAEAEEAYRQACEPPVSFYERPSARASRRSSSSASSSVAKTGRSSRYRMLEDQDFGDDLLDDDDQEEESGGDHELDPYLRPSPSPSPSASPYMSGLSSPPASRAWTILSQAGSSATTPAHSSDRWGKNSKVRTVNVPRSARFPLASPTPAEAASISSSLSSMGALSPPELSSPRDFPSMTMAAVAGSMSASPNHVGGGGVSPMFRRPSSGFGPGLVSPASSSDICPSPAGGTGGMGKWNKSPNLHPIPSPHRQPTVSAWTTSRSPSYTNPPAAGSFSQPSLLAASLKSQQQQQAGDKGKGKAPTRNPTSVWGSGNNNREEGEEEEEEEEEEERGKKKEETMMDDDLKFALELSLAEERSRKER
ncbi:uncharacterized protein UTRI_03490 [Ustilago trichophora]|uniref:F-box domain-containing protein n=1 Tax=Ustilago trichophora TaxID=86804 RepID=A0A5C3E1D0_9BASI|nr:uncharacterized protein UTRI_03490 [Ustilago trichophora]